MLPFLLAVVAERKKANQAKGITPQPDLPSPSLHLINPAKDPILGSGILTWFPFIIILI